MPLTPVKAGPRCNERLNPTASETANLFSRHVAGGARGGHLTRDLAVKHRLGKRGIVIPVSGKGTLTRSIFQTITSGLIWPLAGHFRQQAENAGGRSIDGFHGRHQAALTARLPKPHRLRAKGPRQARNAHHIGRASPRTRDAAWR